MKNNDLVKLYAAYQTGCLGTNVLDTYFAFFANIMLEKEISSVSDKEVRSLFEQRYQIVLPLVFVRQVLGVGMGNGTIIDECGVYQVERDELKKYRIISTDFEHMWKRLLESFKQYCICQDIKLKFEEMENKILFSIDRTDDIILSNEKMDNTEGMGEFDFAWYSYVREIAKVDNELFDFVIAICASNITKQALLYSGNKGESYSGLNVYLDSPMIFALLGMDSKEREESYKLLVSDMKKAGCNVQILDHNYHEVEGIITRAAGWAFSRQYDIRKANNAAKFFHDSEMLPEEITEYCSNVEDKLNEIGIVIKKTDYDVYQNQFQEDEMQLYEMVKGRYTDQQLVLLPEKEDSIKVDVRSIIMIYRERRGQVSVRLSESKDIMLTTNNAIANVCKKYESNRSINSGHIPACISVDLFGAILWLSSPNNLMNYQRKKILADCYEFLKPSKSMIDKYVNSLENAKNMGEIDEKKFLFMRTHPIVLDTLMNITRGDYARFDDRTYLDVYNTIIAQAEKKYEVEVADHISTKEKLEEERLERLALEQRIGEIENNNSQKTKKLEDKMHLLEKQLREREEKDFDRKCSFWGWVWTIAIFGVPYLLVITLAEIMKGHFSDFSQYSICVVAGIILLTLLCAALFNKGKSWCFKEVKKKLETKNENS